MLLAGLLFACMGGLVKAGAGHFSSIEMVFYRSLIGLLVLAGVTGSRGLRMTTPHWRVHVSRSVSGFAALVLYFYCMTHLPLATAVTLNYTSPLFLAVLSAIVLKETPSARLISALLLGFAGALLLLKPTLAASQLLAGLLGLISGLLAGVAYLNVKQLGALGEPDWRTVLYFTLFSTLASGAWLAVRGFSPVTWDNGWILIGLGLTATLAQLAMTRAYRTGKTLVVGALAYSTIAFSSFVGALAFHERLAWSSWLAIGLIVAGGLVATRAAAKPVGA